MEAKQFDKKIQNLKGKEVELNGENIVIAEISRIENKIYITALGGKKYSLNIAELQDALGNYIKGIEEIDFYPEVSPKKPLYQIQLLDSSVVGKLTDSLDAILEKVMSEDGEKYVNQANAVVNIANTHINITRIQIEAVKVLSQ